MGNSKIAPFVTEAKIHQSLIICDDRQDMNYPSGFFWFNVRSTEQYQWSLMTSNFIDFTQEGKREMERGDGEASFLMPSASPSRFH